MENRERRLIEAEHTIVQHGRRLTTLERKISVLHQDLGDLKAVLVNIKWWLIGVGSFYIMEQVGVMPFLKKLVGI